MLLNNKDLKLVLNTIRKNTTDPVMENLVNREALLAIDVLCGDAGVKNQLEMILNRLDKWEYDSTSIKDTIQKHIQQFNQIVN